MFTWFKGVKLLFVMFEVNFCRHPETGNLFLILIPDLGVLNREEDEAITAWCKKWFRINRCHDLCGGGRVRFLGIINSSGWFHKGSFGILVDVQECLCKKLSFSLTTFGDGPVSNFRKISLSWASSRLVKSGWSRGVSMYSRRMGWTGVVPAHCRWC
jgi:hypothetical protein